jgi:hypothetical protein
MNRIFAIALLQVRTAIRSRLFVSLVIVLALAVVGLPLTVKGDGTLMGQVKVILYYTLGLTSIILGTATLWTSSGTISQEIESRQIHLVIVKPVRHFEIWLGKWFGLLAINATLLCFAGLIILCFVHWSIEKAGRGDQERRIVGEQLLVGRRLIRPHDTLQQEVRERFHNMLNKGEIPSEFSRDEAFLEIRKQLIAEKTIVGPLSTKRWVLDIPDCSSRRGYETEKLELKIQFSPVRRGSNPVSGMWRVGTESDYIFFHMTTNSLLEGMHQLTIPLTQSIINAVMKKTAVADNHSRHEMIVEYKNGDNSKSRTVVFDHDHGVELLIRESGFESNLFRSLIVILCRLTLLAALGLTASTLFSFPVATFSTFSIILLSMVTHYFVFMMSTDNGSCCDSHAQQTSRHAFWQLASEKTAKHLDTVLDPVMRLEAVSPISEGVLVPWQNVGKAILTMAIIYPGLLGIAGVLLFRRRELALPYT